jgi:hypothetical protein
MNVEFTPCKECKKKLAGSVCPSCRANRKAIGELKKKIEKPEKTGRSEIRLKEYKTGVDGY